jgi:hypothetical protein
MERRNNPKGSYKNNRNIYKGPPISHKRSDQDHQHNKSHGDSELGDAKIIGTSTKHEKEYYRLTSAPNPELLRTEDTLKSWLPILLSECDNLPSQYNYLNSQLKSIRQDLTVQGIENSFTLLVYKTHAEIALENDDIHEFSVCLIRVLELCQSFLAQPDLCFSMDWDKIVDVYITHIAMKILQLSATQSDSELLDLSHKIQDLNTSELIIDTMKIYKACLTGDYWSYFQIIKTLPKHLRILLKLSGNLATMRNQTVTKIVKAYRPHIELQYVSDLVGFDSTEEFIDYANEKFNGLLLSDDKKYISTANSKQFSIK